MLSEYLCILNGFRVWKVNKRQPLVPLPHLVRKMNGDTSHWLAASCDIFASRMVDKKQRKTLNSRHSPEKCRNERGTRFPVDWSMTKVPNISSYLKRMLSTTSLILLLLLCLTKAGFWKGHGKRWKNSFLSADAIGICCEGLVLDLMHSIFNKFGWNLITQPWSLSMMQDDDLKCVFALLLFPIPKISNYPVRKLNKYWINFQLKIFIVHWITQEEQKKKRIPTKKMQTCRQKIDKDKMQYITPIKNLIKTALEWRCRESKQFS